MRRDLRRHYGNDGRAAVMVEFAVASFLLIFLMLGGIELMRAYLTSEVLGEAARIAARESATHPGGLVTPLDDDIFIETYTAIDLDNLLLPDVRHWRRMRMGISTLMKMTCSV